MIVKNTVLHEHDAVVQKRAPQLASIPMTP